MRLAIAARPNGRAARVARLTVSEAIVLSSAVAVANLRDFTTEGLIDATLLVFLGAAFAWNERAFLTRRDGG